jgi:transcription elongation factor GreA
MGERMTREAYHRLLEGLRDLEQRGRVEIAEAIRHARHFGDLAENAEYQFALDEQAHLEATIGRLRERLDGALVVDPGIPPGDDVVRVASLVEIEDETGERLRRRIAAADPEVAVATLDSPLARAALGARVGDVLEVHAPRRTWRARIVAVQG